MNRTEKDQMTDNAKERSFSELLKASLKSKDTEEWLDVYFTRPIGLFFALIWKRLGVHPNAITTLVITAATDIGGMMMELAALSFLGFGAQPPSPEWGSMLNEGRNFMQSAPWLMIFPGLAIFVTVVIFNMLGDGLRDILDPHSDEGR